MNIIEKRSLSLNALSAKLALLLLLPTSAHALQVEGEAWVDWGAVHNARVLAHQFTLLNDSDVACQVLEVTPECRRCTRFELSDDYLLPGERSILTVTLLTESLSGPVVKGLSLKLAESDQVLQVGFRAKVSPRFNFISETGRGELEMRSRERGEEAIGFIDHSLKDWSGVEVDEIPSWLGGSVSVSGESKNRVSFSAKLADEKLSSGLHAGHLSLRKGDDVVEFSIHVLVEKEYILTPQTLNFSKQKGLQRKILHYRANSRDFYIKKVGVSKDLFRAEVKPAFKPGEYRIYVYANRLEEYSEHDDVVSIETMGSDKPALNIPIFVRP